MSRPRITTGLDIGSSKIQAVAAGLDRDGLFNILAQESSSSKGISRGAFVDLDEAVDSISKVLARLSVKISGRLENIYVNISGQTIRGERSRGMIPISLRGREVTQRDIDKCVNVASTIQLPFDRDIIHKVIQNFSIDDQPWIKNPLGLYASRLACEVYIMTASVNHIQNIYKCVNDAGYDVSEVVFTGVADAESLLDTKDREEGALLLDVGATLTELSIFYGGVLRDIDVVSLGTQDFKGDFKDSVEFNDVLSRVRGRIEELLNKGGKLGCITLTGGLSFADGAIEFLEEGLSYPIKMGIAKEITGGISSLDKMRMVTAIGLARYGLKLHERKAVEEKNIAKRISTKVVEIFNNYF